MAGRDLGVFAFEGRPFSDDAVSSFPAIRLICFFLLSGVMATPLATLTSVVIIHIDLHIPTVSSP